MAKVKVRYTKQQVELIQTHLNILLISYEENIRAMQQVAKGLRNEAFNNQYRYWINGRSALRSAKVMASQMQVDEQTNAGSTV